MIGRGQPQVPRAGEEGKQAPGHPGQLGSAVWTVRTQHHCAFTSHQPRQSSSWIVLYPEQGGQARSLAVRTSVLGLQWQEPQQSRHKGCLRPSEGLKQTLCQGSYQSRKEETHKKRSKEESELLGSSPAPWAVSQPGRAGPGCAARQQRRPLRLPTLGR